MIRCPTINIGIGQAICYYLIAQVHIHLHGIAQFGDRFAFNFVNADRLAGVACKVQHHNVVLLFVDSWQGIAHYLATYQPFAVNNFTCLICIGS